MTSDGLHGYEYDCANQLTRITQTNKFKSEFVYDGFGRRRIRREYAWTGTWVPTSETHYVYDRMLVVQERDGNNTAKVSYTRGLDLSGSEQGAGGIGGLLARTDTNGSAFYHADGNGNITAMINSSGTVFAKYLYDSYGNILAKTGPLADANAYRFSSKEMHVPTGLYYYGFRYYEPNLHRWLNRDPAGERGGWNLYTYAANSPFGYYDSWGLSEQRNLLSGPTATQGGYTDPFGNWHESFCMSCHDGTPAGNFYSSQAMAANNQSWGVFVYQMGLGLAAGGMEGFADYLAFEDGLLLDNWNAFQNATKGQFLSRTECAKAWSIYKAANGIQNYGIPRSMAARSAYLKSIENDWRTPSWMKLWLSKGQVPPGYDVDHIVPLSIGGADTPANMRLQGADLHDLWHSYYHPWTE
jgi:RHS repeat-associated protein